MTWSSSHPRGVPRGATAPSAAPMQWAPEELALDTTSLHDAFVRDAHDAPVVDVPLDAGPDPLEMARLMEEAYARGYEEGRQAGEAGEAARLRTAVQAADDALRSLHAESERYLGNVEANIAALAVAVARHVIGQEIAADKSSLGEMVRQALAEFPIDQAIVVRVNPGDLRAMSAAIPDGTGVTAPRADMQWLSDPRIAPGGCLLEGRDRIVDGRVDTALERLYRRLTYTGA